MDETLEEWLSAEVASDGLVNNSVKTPSENYVCMYSITAASNQLNQCKQCCSHMPIHSYLVGFLGSSYALDGIACFSSYYFPSFRDGGWEYEGRVGFVGLRR